MTEQEFVRAIDEAWFLLEDRIGRGLCICLYVRTNSLAIWNYFQGIFGTYYPNEGLFYFDYAGYYANPDRHFALHLFKEIVLDSKEHLKW